MRGLLLLCILTALPAADGSRWAAWPAVVYDDEVRSAAVIAPGAATAAWIGQPEMALPATASGSALLVAMPREPGDHRLQLGRYAPLAMTLVPCREPWPAMTVAGGNLVGADGRAVVLLDHRRNSSETRRWMLLRPALRQRPSGQPLILGDGLTTSRQAPPWDGLGARAVQAMSMVHCLAAFAEESRSWKDDPGTAPRTIIWSPGNGALDNGQWSSEEIRFPSAISARLEALAISPRCTLLLPPLPVDASLNQAAEERRDALRRNAAALDWTVLDCEPQVGPLAERNRIAPGIIAAGLSPEGRDQLHSLLAKELGR